MKLMLVCALLLPVRSLAAQAIAPASLRASTEQFAAVATLRSRNSVAAEQPGINLGKDPYQHGTRREGIALIVVGVAGIVTGLIVDEPVVTILSAGVGGFGLYLYLR